MQNSRVGKSIQEADTVCTSQLPEVGFVESLVAGEAVSISDAVVCSLRN